MKQDNPSPGKIRRDTEVGQRKWIAGMPLEDRQDYASALFPEDGRPLTEADWRSNARRFRSYEGNWQQRRADILRDILPNEVLPGVLVTSSGPVFARAGSLNGAEIEKIFDEEWPLNEQAAEAGDTP